jgi:hypothetical protein
MRSQHVEFPALTPGAKKCLVAAYKAVYPWHDGHKEDWTGSNRRGQAAFLREVIEQAEGTIASSTAAKLRAIADNLHSPPPSPPTLAQAREADLESTAGRDLVRDFLATLGEGGQQ